MDADRAGSAGGGVGVVGAAGGGPRGADRGHLLPPPWEHPAGQSSAVTSDGPTNRTATALVRATAGARGRTRGTRWHRDCLLVRLVGSPPCRARRPCPGGPGCPDNTSAPPCSAH